MKWYLLPWKRYAQFDGRSRRKEYWLYTLINILIFVFLYYGGAALQEENGIGTVLIILGAVYWLASIIPSLAVAVRRLHDTGKSGWWILIGLVPFVGGVILLIFMVRDGSPGENQYGPNPKQLVEQQPVTIG